MVLCSVHSPPQTSWSPSRIPIPILAHAAPSDPVRTRCPRAHRLVRSSAGMVPRIHIIHNQDARIRSRSPPGGYSAPLAIHVSAEMRPASTGLFRDSPRRGKARQLYRGAGLSPDPLISYCADAVLGSAQWVCTVHLELRTGTEEWRDGGIEPLVLTQFVLPSPASAGPEQGRSLR